MCSYLEWQLNVDPSTLRDFQSRVQRDFAGPGPYPPTVLPQPAPAPFGHQSSANASMPAFATRVALPKDAPVIPSPSIPVYRSSPPDTPETSPHSASTSPASSVSPQTPPDAHGSGFIKVVSASSSPVGAPVIPHGHSHGSGPILVKPSKAVASVPPASSAVAPKKPKTAHGQFAYATRAVW